jgi:NAD(P)-dependent dehydrogenase (short-subunit alcohol dehydrogenase family)
MDINTKQRCSSLILSLESHKAVLNPFLAIRIPPKCHPTSLLAPLEALEYVLNFIAPPLSSTTANSPQFQYLRTLSKDPSNVIVGTARSVADTEAKVKAESLSNVSIVQADLTNPASLNRAASEISKITGGAVDHLIVNGAYLNAAQLSQSPTDYIGQEDVFLDELNKNIHANTAGVLFAINAFLPLIKKSSIKKVIVISTGHAAYDAVEEADIDAAIPYALSKIATNMLVAKYAVLSRKNGDGIIYLALSPGFVYTMHDGPLEEGKST